MTTASMYIHHIATMRPDMNRVCYLNQNLDPIFVWATVAWIRWPS
uniref:Uncharacterized protein n=1 Tax=Brassica campestris TaxID=3711 RepID=A0A3P6AHP5_BRACM|nr:unnamed protein product [Brassica rapa]